MLTFQSGRHLLVGSDGRPATLRVTTFDFSKDKITTVTGSTGGLAAVASNDGQLGIAYIAQGAIVPRPPSPPPATREGGDPEFDGQFFILDGRRVHAPRKDRNQSFFTVVGRDGKTVVKPIALGDQRVMHTAPGVGVAWNPKAKEWGVVWSEFNLLRFARVSSQGKVSDVRKVVVDGFVNSYSRVAWTGTAYVFSAITDAGISVFEIGARDIKTYVIQRSGIMLEPVLAVTGPQSFGVVYRTTRPDPAPAPASSAPPGGRPTPGRPIRVTRPVDLHELWFVAIEDGLVGKPRLVATAASRAIINSPVVGVDGGQVVVVWGERRAPSGFDDRLWLARVDVQGTVVASPRRLEPEEVHQGHASIAGAGCDLAISYSLGDPNGTIRIAAVRSP